MSYSQCISNLILFYGMLLLDETIMYFSKCTKIIKIKRFGRVLPGMENFFSLSLFSYFFLSLPLSFSQYLPFFSLFLYFSLSLASNLSLELVEWVMTHPHLVVPMISHDPFHAWLICVPKVRYVLDFLFRFIRKSFLVIIMS